MAPSTSSDDRVGCPMSDPHGGSTSHPNLYGAWELNSLAVVLIATLFVLGLGVLTVFVAMKRRMRKLKRHLEYGGGGVDGHVLHQARLLDHDDATRCRRVCANCDGPLGECECAAPGHAAMDISMPPVATTTGSDPASQRGRMLQERPASERYVRLPTMTSFETLPSDREGRQWLGQAAAARSRRRRGPFSQSTIASEAHFSATHLSEPADAGNTGATPWTSPSPSTSGVRQQHQSAAALQPPHPEPAPPAVARSRGYPVAAATSSGGHFPAHPEHHHQPHQHHPQQSTARSYAAAAIAAAAKGSATTAVIVGVSSSTAGDTPTDEAVATGVILAGHEAIHASRSLPSGSDWDDDDESGDYEDRSTLSGGSSDQGHD